LLGKSSKLIGKEKFLIGKWIRLIGKRKILIGKGSAEVSIIGL
jgi:hypothetical protein